MKKIILGIVFVFATVTMVNANSNDKVEGVCDQYAMDVFYSAVDEGMSYEDAYNLSNDANDVCRSLHLLANFL